MGVRQDFVDVADILAAAPRVRIVLRQTPAGRTAGTQGPDAAKPAGVFPVLRACGVAVGPPAREAFCLARQVVQRAAERAKAQGKARGVDRIVGRGRAGDRKPLGQAGD